MAPTTASQKPFGVNLASMLKLNNTLDGDATTRRLYAHTSTNVDVLGGENVVEFEFGRAVHDSETRQGFKVEIDPDLASFDDAPLDEIADAVDIRFPNVDDFVIDRWESPAEPPRVNGGPLDGVDEVVRARSKAYAVKGPARRVAGIEFANPYELLKDGLLAHGDITRGDPLYDAFVRKGRNVLTTTGYIGDGAPLDVREFADDDIVAVEQADAPEDAYWLDVADVYPFNIPDQSGRFFRLRGHGVYVPIPREVNE